MIRRVAACDLGKASASFVTASVGEGGVIAVEDAQYHLHEGNPFELFAQWYRDKDVAACAALGATGIYADELAEPVFILPEDSCQEAALEQQPELEDSLNLVSIGARGYGVLSRRPSHTNGNTPRYLYQYIENDKCSSGTGENIRKITGRFGLFSPTQTTSSCSTRSWHTPRPPFAAIQTRGPICRSSRSAVRTPSTSASRAAASSRAT